MARGYAIYIRKSRIDIEAEAHGQGDTLLRHRTRLLALAEQSGFPIVKIYEEVVSGETITSRPQMQQLLQDVERGQYSGVLVMEVERLARGDTIDQGIVARAFQYSGTKIVTPVKTYDPTSEFDQEYFEFGLFMSRREYKMINRRQQAGRLASVSEGKWPSNRAPYGYSREKLNGQKGWTLTPDEHAPIVTDIFRWYTAGAVSETGCSERLGASRIARRLNERHILSPGGKDWTNSAVGAILRNPAYAGWVRWGNRSQTKQMRDGEIVRSRPRAKSGDGRVRLCRGLHPSLVSQETFDLAQRLFQENPSHPGPKTLPLKNPLAGLVRCDGCGRNMVRRPGHSGSRDLLLCPYPSCPTVGTDLARIEAAVMAGLRCWLRDFELTPPDEDQAAAEEERASLLRSITEADRELEQIGLQQSTAHDLVEQGVYTPEVFARRLEELSRRRLSTEEDRKRLYGSLKILEQSPKKEPAASVRFVLDTYNLAKTATEKNDLLRSILDHVTYHKTVGGRCRNSDLRITIYPRLPEMAVSDSSENSKKKCG